MEFHACRYSGKLVAVLGEHTSLARADAGSTGQKGMVSQLRNANSTGTARKYHKLHSGSGLAAARGQGMWKYIAQGEGQPETKAVWHVTV